MNQPLENGVPIPSVACIVTRCVNSNHATMKTFPIVIILSLLALKGTSQDTTYQQSKYASSIDLSEASKGSWIGLNGTVKAAGGRSFILEMGEESIAVGLTGEDLREHEFEAGSGLIVFGRADKDLFERRVIKARAIAMDGQEQVIGQRDSIMGITSPVEGGMVIHGRVNAIDGRMITLGEDDHRIILDTSDLSYDPAEARDDRRVETGHLVTGTGSLGENFWTDRSVKVTTLKVMAYGDGSGDQKAGRDRDLDGDE
jgi:hypothetical protein